VAIGAILVLALKPVEAEEQAFVHVDKLKHVAAFTVLWVLGARAGLRALPLAVGLLAFGAAIEVLQTFVPPREPSWADWLADAAGVFIGWLATTRRGLQWRQGAA
jgi:VanZ family protein